MKDLNDVFLDDVLALRLLKHYSSTLNAIGPGPTFEALVGILEKDFFSYDRTTNRLYCRGYSVSLNAEFSALGGNNKNGNNPHN